MQKKILVFTLFIIDTILLYLSLFLVVFYRFHNAFAFTLFTAHLLPFTIIYIIWLIVFYFWDFYTLKPVWDFRDIFKAMMLNGILAIVFFYVIPYFRITPKINLVLNMTLYYFLFTGWRYLFSSLFKQSGKKIHIMLIGVDNHSLQLIHSLYAARNTPYVLSTVINLDNHRLPGNFITDRSLDIRESLEDVDTLITQKQINTVIVTNKWYSELFQELYHLIHRGVQLYHIASFWEEYNKSIPIYATTELWFLENLRGFSKDLYEKQKRILDILICICLLPFFVCASFFIVIAVLLDSRGAVIFKQKRVGKNNRPFYMYKYRTMRTDAEKHGPQWASRGDPRVTRVGRLLRPTRLDELPQLINILKGDMNFIGPRAERPEFVSVLAEKVPHYALRHLIRPGLTGWAQVNFDYAASEEDTAKKLEYDLYYLKNRSHLLDLTIIVKTLGIIVKRKGR